MTDPNPADIREVYIHYLRSKLEAGGEPRLIQTVRGAGYALRTINEVGKGVASPMGTW